MLAGFQPSEQSDPKQLGTPAPPPKHSVRLAPLPPSDADNCRPLFFEPAIIFVGSDELAGVLDTQTATAAECCRQCAAASACTHWTWLADGACQLKRGSTSPSRPPLDVTVVSGRVPVGLRADRLAAPLDANTSARVSARFGISVQSAAAPEGSIPWDGGEVPNGTAFYFDPTLAGADPALLLGLGIDPALIPAIRGAEPNDTGPPQFVPGPGEDMTAGQWAALAAAQRLAGGPPGWAPSPLPTCRWEAEDAPALEAGLVRCGRPTRQPPSALPARPQSSPQLPTPSLGPARPPPEPCTLRGGR